jgi:hypothetical protein
MAGVQEDEEEWLYHLPEFLDRVREQGAQRVVESLDANIGGVLYHHRGARVLGHNATFAWGGGERASEDESEDEDEGKGAGGGEGNTFDLEIDAVGSRAAWAVFDAGYEWDFYLVRAAGDTPCLAWMTDAEFDAEEAESFADKEAAVGTGRFSFGLYLQSPTVWEELEERARESDAPCFVHRPSGRTVVPEEGLEAFESVVPPELLPDGDAPPGYLGLVEADVSGG